MSSTSEAYLVVDARSLAPAALIDAIKRSSAACVLLLSGEGSPTAQALRALIEAGQRCGTAMLLETDAAQALELGADGVHQPLAADDDAALQGLRAARSILGAGRIVGAAAGGSRHRAMLLAESGADYVAFDGSTDAGGEATADLVAWWSELFEIAVVAWMATSPEEAQRFAALGSDFVAAGPAGGLAASVATLEGLRLPLMVHA